LSGKKGNRFGNTSIGSKIYWPNVLIMVKNSHICVRLCMKDLISRLEPCYSPCIRESYDYPVDDH